MAFAGPHKADLTMAKQPPKPKREKKPETFYDAKLSIEAIQHEPYEEGFTWRSVLGALFVSFVMLPGIIFMGLMIGQDLGDAADWVVIILFVELSRRSFVQLKKQELYILKYTLSQLTHVSGGMMLGGGIFASLVWNRYMRNSEAFRSFGIDQDVPDWVAPFGDAAYGSLVSSAWWPVIGVIVGSMLLSKFTQFSLGYLAYKITSDAEKLPFPLAPIAAEGTIALAETSQDKNKRGYRFYCFSLGVMLGGAFGLVYVALPVLTQAFLGTPVELIPIPFWDATTYVDSYLPAATIGISLNLGILLTGFVLPWRIVIGMFVTTMVFQLIVNPVLQINGMIPHWEPGKDAIETHIATTLDVYLSVGIGTALAIAIVGFAGIGAALLKWRKRAGVDQDTYGHEDIEADGVHTRTGFDLKAFWRRDKERGDPPTWVPIVVWIVASVGFVWMSHYLINVYPDVPAEERFSMWWLIAFAFIWTPINTYINARMSGIAGQSAGIPMLSEAAIFTSGYKRVDIWFAPLPLHNYGNMADRLRETQLTRTKFTSLIKAEILIFPLLAITSLIFWSYITGLGPIPSDAYPYVQKFWPQHATMRAVWASGLSEGDSLLLTSLKPWLIVGATVGTVCLFGAFSLLGVSTQYIYGGLGAMNGYPHMALPLFAGALLGRYVFARVFGREQWVNYAPILAAGFGAGMGLIGMLAIAINFLQMSVKGAM